LVDTDRRIMYFLLCDGWSWPLPILPLPTIWESFLLKSVYFKKYIRHLTSLSNMFQIFLSICFWQEVELGSSHTLGRCSTPFCISYFWNRVLLYVQAHLDCDPICASPCSWDDRPVPPCPAIDWDGALSLYNSPTPLQTAILPVSASWAVRVIGMGHCAQLFQIFFKVTFQFMETCFFYMEGLISINLNLLVISALLSCLYKVLYLQTVKKIIFFLHFLLGSFYVYLNIQSIFFCML
jgi:hypothetical protein